MTDNVATGPKGPFIELYDADGSWRSLQDMTGEIVKITVEYANGNTDLAARNLKIGRSTLYRWIDQAPKRGYYVKRVK